MCGMPERTRVCVEKRGELSNNKTMNQSLFVFFLLHEIERAINFGTPCTFIQGHSVDVMHTKFKLFYAPNCELRTEIWCNRSASLGASSQEYNFQMVTSHTYATFIANADLESRVVTAVFCQ